jgi:hypothetical protein
VLAVDRQLLAVAVAIAAGGAALGAALTSRSSAQVRGRRAANTHTPPQHLAAGRLHPRPGAVPPGTVANSSDLFSDRVFADAADGFALANHGNAQYPARSVDGGRSWEIDGPQLHVDAADGAEGVGYVGVSGPRTLFAYGSSVVDVTSDGGRTWWQTYLGELVVAVVPRNNGLTAYVQQQLSNTSTSSAVTRQYVSHDGGRHWTYSTALGG